MVHFPAPHVSEAKVLEKIVARFNEAERSLWRTGARLRSISGPHEHAYNVYAHSTINRRYCQAKAWLKSGHSRRVYYVIEQGMGLAGFGWEVGYCLKGSDRWHAYDGWCRVLRKIVAIRPVNLSDNLLYRRCGRFSRLRQMVKTK